MRKVLVTLLCLCLLACVATGCSGANSSSSPNSADPQASTGRTLPPITGSLKIGVSMTDITPEGDDIVLMGGTEGVPATGVDTRLYIKAMVISDGAQTAAIVTMDTLKYMGAPMAVKAVARATGIPEDNIIITASHTHSAPLYTVYQNLGAMISDTVKAAFDSMELCAAVTASTQVAGLSRNRRLLKDGHCFPAWTVQGDTAAYEPAGTADPGLVTLAAVGADGKYKAILWNYACHANANTANTVSADYPGHVQAQLAQSLGYEVPALFLPGACGDVNPGASVSAMGSALASGILSSLETGTPVVGDNVRIGSQKLKLPGRADPVFAEEDIRTVWPDQLEGYRAGFNSWLERAKASYDAPIVGISIGDAFAVVSNPGELFNSLGTGIRTDSPFACTMVAEQSNGALGYIPTEHDFTLGGYETWFAEHSYLAVGAGETVRDTSIDVLNALAGSAE